MMQKQKRKDWLSTKIVNSKVALIREAKLNGYSLGDISKAYHIAKSTASLYCRDLFYAPYRKYASESDARKAIALRGGGKDHCVYKYCLDCGEVIRNEHMRCLICNLNYQKSTGETAKFILSGKATRFSRVASNR